MNVNRNMPIPRDLDGLFLATQQCLHRYDFQGAVEMLQRAHKLEPTNDKIMVDLGAAYAKAFDFASAQRWFDEAMRISKTPVDALNAIGNAWLEVRDFEAAKKAYDKVLEQKHVPMVTLLRLSDIYTRMRRLEDAAKMSESAMKLYGPEGPVLLARAKVCRQTKQMEMAEKLVRMAVGKSANDTATRAAAWYELGAILDQKGDYHGAMAALLEAKNIMRLGAGQPLKILQKKQVHMQEMAKTANVETAQRWRKAGAREFQPTRKMSLLCGHARSGTTLLEYVLDAHPEVMSAEESTVYHNKAYFQIGQAVSSNSTFVSALEWLPVRTMRQIRADYFRGIDAVLGEPLGDKLLLDKNPANTFDIPSIARIFPENKFLCALRDPRDVCLSCFMQPVNLLPDTAAWLTLEGTIHHFTLIMGMWAAWKPCLAENALEVRYEDLVGDLETSARRVLEFLGLGWDDKVMHFNEHASTKIVRSPTFAEVTKPLYRDSIGRWKNYQKFFEPHLEELTPLLRAFGYE